jgi:DNA-binding NarL/FixJ family response regulator
LRLLTPPIGDKPNKEGARTMYTSEEAGLHEIGGEPGSAAKRLRVLVAADSRLVAEALMFSLDTDPKLEPIGYALDGWEALEHVVMLEPDAVLVGPRLASLDPFKFSRFAHEISPDLLLIMLCERLVPANVEAAYAIGVADCLPVDRSVDQLLRAISDARLRQQAFQRGRRQAALRPALSVVAPGELDARP